ncbi:Fc.00g048500.m01.CDS01 [Cosmosporella sp. VM-42]
MSHITLATAGLAAVDARKWDEAATKLSTALETSPNPAWLIGRSRAHIGLKRYEEALDDANQAWYSAYDRNKRELLSEAQYRRAVAYFRLKQYANADACCIYSMRVSKGSPAVEKEDPAKKLVDENGFWMVTFEDAKAEAHENEASRTSNSTNAMSAAMAGSNDPKLKDWRQASALRNQILYALDKLPTDDPARKLTTTLKPVFKDVCKKQLASSEPAKASKSTAETKAAATTAPVVPADTPVRLQEFQSNTTMSVSIFSKGVNKDTLEVNFLPFSVHLDSIKYPNGDEKPYELHLWGEIDCEGSKYTVTPSKVELLLKKKAPGKWAKLKGEIKTEATETVDAAAVEEEAKLQALKDARNKAMKEAETPSIPVEDKGNGKAPTTSTGPAKPAGPSYPSSSRTGPKNWDAVLADEDEEDGKDVNFFFKNLFKNATPEQQRAMMKSFTESSGTSLSTDWNDVKDRTVETVPPEGVEAKKWD